MPARTKEPIAFDLAIVTNFYLRLAPIWQLGRREPDGVVIEEAEVTALGYTPDGMAEATITTYLTPDEIDRLRDLLSAFITSIQRDVSEATWPDGMVNGRFVRLEHVTYGRYQ